MKLIRAGSLFLLIIFSSCSFNFMFLVPDKISKNTKQIKVLNREKDTVVISYSGSNFQPMFIKNKDTVQDDFTIESVVFKSTNGNNLNGWLIKPKNTAPEITLLHFHGNAGNLLSQYKAMTPLIKNGFQIFLFDYSGFGFSEGKATRKNVLLDGLSALDYIKTRDDVKETKIVLYGQSLGGHLAAVIGEKRQNEIAALVIEGAFSSHNDIAAHTARQLYLPGFLGRLFVQHGYCAKQSIVYYKKPLLIIHSTEDEIVPFYMGEKIFSLANEPKEFYEIKKCHICGPKYYSDEISEKIKKMLLRQAQ